VKLVVRYDERLTGTAEPRHNVLTRRGRRSRMILQTRSKAGHRSAAAERLAPMREVRL